MRALDKIRLRLRSLFRRPDVERELETELRFHLDQLVDENVASGMTPEAARRAALRSFGGVARFQEECRDMRRLHLIESVIQDLRYAIRTLAKSPAFTAVVVATLALGIGGATAVFSVVEAALLAPLPYEAPGQLVRLYQQEKDDASSRGFLTARHFAELRDSASSFEDVAAIANYSENGLDLIYEGTAERLRVLKVTSGYFSTLRSRALRGRAFEREDEFGAHLVVLSDELWRTRFDADPAVLGRTIRLSAEPYVIVGVAPEGFEDPIEGEVDLWLPYDLEGDVWPDNHSLSAVGRLRGGATLAQARGELAVLEQTFEERWPTVRSNAVVAYPLQEDLTAQARGPLHALLLAVGLVLLVACVNVANLFLVRATGRTRELAVRSALGSGGLRIARQLLVESVLLAAMGGFAGLGLAIGAQRALLALGGEAIPRLDEAGLDPVVLSVASLLTLATGLGFGMLPAVRFARIDPRQALHSQSRSATGSRGQGRLRSGLAAAQVALALTLLAGAGVLMASFYRLQKVDLGVRTESVLAFDLGLPTARYDAGRRAAFQEELARRLESIPGVTQAGGTSRLPATGPYHAWGTLIKSGPRAGDWLSGQSQHRTISGDFFEALGIPVLAGRAFGARDDAAVAPRAVVSALFARNSFPGVPLESVVGQRIATVPSRLEREIIGVVGDVALDPYGALEPTVYHAHRQFAVNRNWLLTQVVATELPPESILDEVRSAVAEMDPELVVYRAAPLDEVVGRGVARERFALVLMGAFAAVALALAAVGLYGVLAYSVRQRTQEIGIRMALGATAARMRRLILRQAAAVVGIGLAAGLGGALAIGRWLSSLVFETSPRDPRILLTTALVLAAVALLSAWLPAWRASRVEPRIAMQEE